MLDRIKNQFASKKGKKRLIFWGAGLLLAAAVFAVAAQGKTVPVTEGQVEIGTVTKLIEDSAVVESMNQRTVQAGVAGELIRYLREPGDSVAKGDILAEIDATNLGLSLNGLQAQMRSLIAARDQAGHGSSEDIRKAKAQLETDRIAVAAAQRTKDQNALLLKTGAVSQEEYDLSAEAWETAMQTAEISSAAYDGLVSGLTPQQERKFAADIDALQAQINQARISHDKYQIISPIDGVVTRKYSESGIQVMPGDNIMEVADSRSVRLETDLLASDAGRIQLGARVRAFDEEAGIEVAGSVTKIHPKAFNKLSDLGIEQKRVRVEMSAENPPASLRLGMEMDLEIIEASVDNVMRVPDSAVFKLNEKSYVFRVMEGKAQLTEVSTGLEGKDFYEIRSGLAAKDIFIVAPGNDISDGVRVEPDSNLKK